jgi:hypothetical protein
VRHCSVERLPNPVVVFADGKEALEVVPLPVETKSGEETGGPAVPVHEWVNVDVLKLRDAGLQDKRPALHPGDPVLGKAGGI